MIIILVFTAVGLFSTVSAETDYHRTSVRAVKWLLEQDIDYAIVDARGSEDYEDSHVPGAINIPLSELKTKALAELPDKEQIESLYVGNCSVLLWKTLSVWERA